MKTIKVKSYNNNDMIAEAIKIGGDIGSYSGPLQQRIVDALRLAKECRKAAKMAEEQGDTDDADWLNKRANDYEQAAKNWNQDSLGDGSSSSEGSATDDANSKKQSKNNKQNKDETAAEAADRAQQAADRAKNNAEEAKNDAAEAQKAADEAAKNGDQEAANKAEQAAQKAKDAADKAQDAANQAQEAPDKAKDAAKNNDTNGAKEAADQAEKAANQAEKAANQAAKAEKQAEGSDNADDTDSGQGNESEQDGKDNNSEGNSEDADNQEDGQDSNSSKSKSKSQSNSDSNSSDSDSDSDSDDSSQSQSQGKQGQSGDNQNDQDDQDQEDSEAPVKDPFADDEDIPQLNLSGGKQGQEPKDPTIDDIIKHLQGLSGEAKRGAIDGLSDLLKNKKESLSEDFNKGIRDFSDTEWDSLNDETIERIERLYKLDKVKDLKKAKSKFKRWSENPINIQSLEDEEEDNARHDILQRRKREKELDRYSDLATLHEFELDFEECIKDQVTDVLETYLSYDEINPEYEGEEIIVKSEVSKIIPKNDMPSIAVFYDKSGSWDETYWSVADKAIATVKEKYVDKGLCILDIWYFGDRVGSRPYGLGTSTGAWPQIINTIKKYDYKNVIIMSDHDIGDQNNHGESYTVEGCVWWLWKAGDRAHKCVTELKGMKHNFECKFYA